MPQHNLIQKFKCKLEAQRFWANATQNYPSALKMAFN